MNTNYLYSSLKSFKNQPSFELLFFGAILHYNEIKQYDKKTINMALNFDTNKY